ncbi:MAG: 3-dehydro-L-gulonate 2-dehydrogenase [Bacteroidales bacterium]|nr:3-dehydro-L-gulonate 2-dehydrogenase [Bacteroidales bacterium]
MNVSFQQMQQVLYELFLTRSFSGEKARLLADVFSENTLSGVHSHGINRVPLFIEYVDKGIIHIDAEAEMAASLGSIERWDGRLGPGIVNAVKCTNRAVELAKLHGMGLVALRNTNHWMRGGTYGLQAAEAGCIALFFTNTQPNMPPWGGKESRTGNNPLVVAIPRKEGHILLDMALSQFAFGKIHDYQLRGEQLPFPGGWDDNHELSSDPEKILPNERGLPIGYWKGSALSMVLDMLATLLSAGNSTFRIGQQGYETGISQVYLCIYPEIFGDRDLQQRLLNEIIDYTHDVEPMSPGDRTYFPGERSAMTREKNLKEGIPVDEGTWKNIQGL